MIGETRLEQIRTKFTTDYKSQPGGMAYWLTELGDEARTVVPELVNEVLTLRKFFDYAMRYGDVDGQCPDCTNLLHSGTQCSCGYELHLMPQNWCKGTTRP